MIGIIDYKAGNLTSVARALQYINEPCVITSDPLVLGKADRVIFPGVGAAGEAMSNLRQSGLDKRIKQWIKEGKPVLGICLGTQVVFSFSEEDNNTPCLDIVPASVKLFPEGMSQDNRLLKIPHMGWNQVEFVREHPVFSDIPEGSEFYFVHSYYPAPADKEWIIGQTDYGIRFCSAIAKGNLVAVQFHPEKSGRPGLKILENFCCWGGGDAQ